jgi:hypothetical protein
MYNLFVLQSVYEFHHAVCMQIQLYQICLNQIRGSLGLPYTVKGLDTVSNQVSNVVTVTLLCLLPRRNWPRNERNRVSNEHRRLVQGTEALKHEPDHSPPQMSRLGMRAALFWDSLLISWHLTWSHWQFWTYLRNKHVNRLNIFRQASIRLKYFSKHIADTNKYLTNYGKAHNLNGPVDVQVTGISTGVVRF